MKSTLRLLVVSVCAGILASGCKKEEPATLTAQALAGVWGATDSKQALADESYEYYFRFTADQTIETFGMYETGCTYAIGLFGAGDDRVNYRFAQMRMYEYNTGVTRYVSHINNDQHGYGFTVREISENLIHYENSNGNYYLHKVKDIPSSWNAELSAPGVDATEESLTGQWDFVNVYRVESTGGTSYRSIINPESEGMTLAEHGKPDKCQFWINYLYYKLIAEQKITNDKSIYIMYADCQWSMDKSLTLSCSRYQTGTTDASGQFAAEQTVVPEEPVKAEFAIHALTEYYLILSAYDYQLGTTGYYAFHRNSGTKSNMPEKQGINGTVIRCSNRAQEMKNCRKMSFLE